MTPHCDMTKDCTMPVAMIDRQGYVYCQHHGLQRRASQPCRKLTAPELRTLERGEPIARY